MPKPIGSIVLAITSSCLGALERAVRLGRPGRLGAAVPSAAPIVAFALLWMGWGFWTPVYGEDAGSNTAPLLDGRDPEGVADEPTDSDAAALAQATASRVAELADIRGEIETLQRRLATVRNKESGLEDQLKTVKLELEIQEAQVAEATAAADVATARAESAERQINELETALAQVRGDLGRRLVGLYRLGGQGYLRLFLALEPNENLLPAIRQLRFLVRRDEMALDRYLTTLDELSFQRRRLDVERRDAAEWQLRQAQRRDALVEVRRKHERTMAAVTAERRRLAARTLELKDKERKLARLIGSLVNTDDELSGTPIQDFRGVLDWPSQGDVKIRFGPRKDPRYRTEVPHNGIDIEVDEGSSVRAVFPGQVLYAAPFEGYGTMVVVHHPGRVFTLYAGLRELQVGKGDVLSLGDVVGHSADVVYFEVRVENEPQDPLLWLR